MEEHNFSEPPYKLAFENNKKKVKYIADHFITLQNILDVDEPLSTMLIDMINRAIYGANTPIIYTEEAYIPFKVLKDHISLPPPPAIMEDNEAKTDILRIKANSVIKMERTIETYNYKTDKTDKNDELEEVQNCNIF
jgi:hypothetical protein